MPSINSLSSLVLGVLASTGFLAPVGGWESHGPPFPFVSDIAVSPEDELVVYATANDAFRGSDGSWQYPSAVFRSSDGGLTWVSLASAPAGELATALAIDPFTPTELLATTVGPSGSRVYRTIDGGATWYSVVDFPSCFGPSIAFDSTLPNRAFAACGELVRSDDGTRWSRLSVTIPAYSSLSTGADGAVYAVEGDHVLRSQDHGDSWIQIVHAPASCPSITALAVDPENPSIIYIGTGRPTPQGRFDCGGLYKSVDGGSTLARAPLPDQFVTDVTVDATDASIVYTCSVSVGFFSPRGAVSRSLDAGHSWHEISPIEGGPIDRLVPSASGRLLYGSVDQAWGGVFRRSIRKTRLVSPRAAP
jgi:photosystem II stability/assembly factor-like uncharacterized protein